MGLGSWAMTSGHGLLDDGWVVNVSATVDNCYSSAIRTSGHSLTFPICCLSKGEDIGRHNRSRASGVRREFIGSSVSRTKGFVKLLSSTLQLDLWYYNCRLFANLISCRGLLAAECHQPKTKVQGGRFVSLKNCSSLLITDQTRDSPFFFVRLLPTLGCS